MEMYAFTLDCEIRSSVMETTWWGDPKMKLSSESLFEELVRRQLKCPLRRKPLSLREIQSRARARIPGGDRLRRVVLVCDCNTSST